MYAYGTFNARVMEARGELGRVHGDHEGAAAVQQLQVRRALHPVSVARKPEPHLEIRLWLPRWWCWVGWCWVGWWCLWFRVSLCPCCKLYAYLEIRLWLWCMWCCWFGLWLKYYIIGRSGHCVASRIVDTLQPREIPCNTKTPE